MSNEFDISILSTLFRRCNKYIGGVSYSSSYATESADRAGSPK